MLQDSLLRDKISHFLSSGVSIVSAMPCLGKSSSTIQSELDYKEGRTNEKYLDLESSDYKWVVINGEKKLDPNFPMNYLEALIRIPETFPEVTVIFIASHKEVRDLLDKYNIPYSIVIPSLDRKDEILEGCRLRGNDENFIKMYDENYEDWVQRLMDEKLYHSTHILGRGHFIDRLFIDMYIRLQKK